jgi:hypothetical protein
MTFARRLAHVENIPQQDSAQNAFNKLARTFAAQVETLKDYRSKGEQKMTVQHVHVAEGGQAIVGNVNSPAEGMGARQKVGEQPHALTYAPGVDDGEHEIRSVFVRRRAWRADVDELLE